MTVRLILLISALLLPALAQRDVPLDDDKVHVEAMPYLVFGGMGGDLTLRGRQFSFSQSAGDVLSNLQFGFMGRGRVTRNRWFAGVDYTYMGLGAANRVVDAGVDQNILELSGGYRASQNFEVLGGVRYNNNAIDLTFRTTNEPKLSQGVSWWDPFVGARTILPLGEKYSISTRFDIGGFGAGSRIAINAEPMFNMKIGKRGTLHAGWKFYYVDYKDNNNLFRYDVLSQGPLVGTTLTW